MQHQSIVAKTLTRAVSRALRPVFACTGKTMPKFLLTRAHEARRAHRRAPRTQWRAEISVILNIMPARRSLPTRGSRAALCRPGVSMSIEWGAMQERARAESVGVPSSRRRLRLAASARSGKTSSSKSLESARRALGRAARPRGSTRVRPMRRRQSGRYKV